MSNEWISYLPLLCSHQCTSLGGKLCRFHKVHSVRRQGQQLAPEDLYSLMAVCVRSDTGWRALSRSEGFYETKRFGQDQRKSVTLSAIGSSPSALRQVPPAKEMNSLW